MERLRLPDNVTEREAEFLLEAFARVKAGSFGRLTISVSDSRIVDIEVTERVDHNRLRRL